MSAQLAVVRSLLLGFVIATAVLVVLVVVSKLRRDRAEQSSGRSKARILQAWQSNDYPEMLATCRRAARGSVQRQSDYLMCCIAADPALWWTAASQARLLQAAQESGLRNRLERQLHSRRAVRRGLAAAIGGYAGTALAPSQIAQLFADQDSTVRTAAAAALEHLGTPEAARELIRGLAEERLPAPRLIERLGHGWAVPSLLYFLNGASDTLVCGLLRALGLAEDPRCIAELRRLASTTGNDEVRIQAIRAIGRCSRHASHPVRKEIEQFARRQLTDSNAVIRSSAIQVLAKAGFAEDIPIISACAYDPDWFVRRDAARALASFGEAGREELRVIALGDDEYAAHRATQQLALESLNAVSRPA
ncbi:MAG: HEAT repeat domain-containing protein [Candidatus Nanopelagicales bacterium]